MSQIEQAKLKVAATLRDAARMLRSVAVDPLVAREALAAEEQFAAIVADLGEQVPAELAELGKAS